MAYSSRRGFTLIELLVVLAIILILAGFLLPAILRVQGTADFTRAEKTIQSIHLAQEAFRTEHGFYLTNTDGSGDTEKAYIVGDRSVSANRKYNRRGQRVNANADRVYTMVDVLREFGAAIDENDVAGDPTYELQDPWGNPMLCGELTFTSGDPDAPFNHAGMTKDDWEVRGFKEHDLVVFSKGADTSQKNAVIYDASRDTGLDAPGGKRVVEPGARRWTALASY